VSPSVFRVLVVDDKSTNRRALENTLADLDVEVVSVDSGSSALKQVLKHSFSVILMDVDMPDMDGFETAEIIASYQLDKVIPIIFITAKDLPIGKSQWQVEGTVDYLVKPYNPESLLAKIRVFIILDRQQQQVTQALTTANQIKERSELLVESAGQGLVVIDNQFKVTFMNKMACTLLTTNKEDLVGFSIKPFIHPDAKEDWFQSPIYCALNEGQNVQVDDALFANSHHYALSVEYTLAVIYADGNADGAVLLFQDITERKIAQEKLAFYAQHDQLTGVYNRRMFRTLLEESLAFAKRYKSSIALHYIDLDQFKIINDGFGHDAGDAVLKESVTRIERTVRDVDMVARLGGDEFCIIQRIDDDSEFSAASLAQRLIEAFQRDFYIEGHVHKIGCSIGIAQFPAHADTVTGLIKAADTAMYNVKEGGRNSYCFFNHQFRKQLDEHMGIVAELKTALVNKELYLVYQPQIDTSSNSLIGVEALMRWKNPRLGQIGPDIFIPIAEKTGLINAMGKWCLEEAVSQAKEWSRKYNLAVPVSVNISVHQIMSEHFVTHIETLLSDFEVVPNLLKLEMTETVLMGDPEHCIAQLAKLDSLGIKTSIDDFGTGYSSLTYLGVIPATCLKIDKSFITQIDKNVRNQNIVDSIIGLAKSIKLSVIAEGVEGLNELNFLVEHGCSNIQGYYFSKPLSVHDMSEYIAKREKAPVVLYEHPLMGVRNCSGKTSLQ